MVSAIYFLDDEKMDSAAALFAVPPDGGGEVCLCTLLPYVYR